MSDWSAGYAADIEYLASYYREQTPRHLALACNLSGFEAPALDRGYSYCELGCGLGFTLNLLAAADSGGQFFGIDFNPAHIARARALAAAAGLENVAFHEASFEELAAPGSSLLTTQFDFIVLHGVYSWVSRENRRAIVALLRRWVKPGGLVYISYNAMPGWARDWPLQRLLLDHAELNSVRSDRQIEAAIGLAENLVQANALHSLHKPLLEDMRKRLDRGEVRYLVHEYLNRNWEPLYFSDVAREVGEAKLSFVGSATLIDNFDHLQLTSEQRELLAAVPRALRETVKDHCVNKRFRRDLFVRGARPLSDQQRKRRLDSFRLALAVPRRFVELKLDLPVGQGSLSPRTYNPLFDALVDGPKSVGELLGLRALREAGSTIESVELAGALVGTRQAAPVRDATPTDHARARRFNEVLAEQLIHEGSNSSAALASATLGAGIPVVPLELLIWAQIAREPKATAEAIAAGVLARLDAAGESLMHEGRPVGTDADRRNTFTAEMRELLEDRAPLWRSLALL